MISCKRRVSIDCGLEDAFEYVADWHNYRAFMPMFTVMDPTSLVQYGVGTSLDTTVAIGKVEIRTTLDITEFLKNKKIVMKATKGFLLRAQWEFKDIGGKVLITYDFDYDLPPGLTFRTDQKNALERDVESLACRSMELLKWLLDNRPKEQEPDY
ncbi:MAG: SRPBCC family protein [Thermoplasmata archaeon]|nr:SRPBCC family protein [Thermoplasmata archaeon]